MPLFVKDSLDGYQKSLYAKVRVVNHYQEYSWQVNIRCCQSNAYDWKIL